LLYEYRKVKVSSRLFWELLPNEGMKVQVSLFFDNAVKFWEVLVFLENQGFMADFMVKKWPIFAKNWKALRRFSKIPP